MTPPTNEKEEDHVAPRDARQSGGDDIEAPRSWAHEKSDAEESSVVQLAGWKKQKEPQQYDEAAHTVTTMPDAPSRDEIAARLEAAEARTETRFAHLSGSLDLRFGDLGHKIDHITNSMSGLVSAVQEVKADNKATRITIIVTVVASVLAGLAAIWVTQGNLLAAFQASIAVRPAGIEAPAPHSK